MLRWQVNCVVALALIMLSVTLEAAVRVESVTFPSPPSSSTALFPGVNNVYLPPITSVQSDQIVQSRVIPANLNQPHSTSTLSTSTGLTASVSSSTAPTGPASIVELARALKNDPDLIYEYVHNNIEYYPIWGVQKGALGTILDNKGTAFDQAALMVALLRQSGYTATYVKGSILLSAADLENWLGIDTSNTCGIVNNYFNLGGVPVDAIAPLLNFTNCSTAAPSPLVGIAIGHVWVKVIISGTAYYFDPSFKQHNFKTGIDLKAASGYDAATYLAQAKAGSTQTPDYIQGVNRTNIRKNLTSYAINLSNYLRTNLPAGVLDDVVGGMSIIPTSGSLRQTSLPYQYSTAVTEWTDIPANYKPTLNIQYQGINQTYTSDFIYGHRLTITYNASLQPVLMLDGLTQDTGTAVASGSVGKINIAVTHQAYGSPRSDQTFTQDLKAGGTFLIANGWGAAGRGVIEQYRQNMEQATATGGIAGSEAVLGSSLAILSSTWIAQVNIEDAIADRLSKTNTLFHHQVGIAGYNTSPYVDLGGNALAVASPVGSSIQAGAASFHGGMQASILESTAVQQISGVSAVSTVKLIDIAASNNDKIYDVNKNNFAAIQSNLLSCAATLPSLQSAVALDGHRLILPMRCNITEASWSGPGYFDIYTVPNVGSSIGAIIGGTQLGGMGSLGISTINFSGIVPYNSTSSYNSSQWGLVQWGDPIDMTKGNFLYSHDDISVGVGSYPQALKFQSLYSSGARTQNDTMGYGWTHNFASSATLGTDGFQGLGEDSALDAVNSLVETMVSLDLLSDTNKPLDKIVIATLGQRWFGDQLINNTVIVKQGLNGEVFVQLPDGTYNAPPGNSARVIKNADGTYSYETLHRNKLNFNAAGDIATYNDAGGVQVKFTYDASKNLTSVANSLGRTLTLTYTSGRVTNVGDGIGECRLPAGKIVSHPWLAIAPTPPRDCLRRPWPSASPRL